MPSERWDERERRLLGWSLLASVSIHAILVVVWRTEPAAAGGPAETARAAPVAALGGGALQALSIAPPRPLETPAPPEAPLAEEPVVEIPEIGGSFSITLGMPGPMAGEASGTGPSVGSGLGGTGARTTSPVPRSLVPEWDPPGEVRGMRVTARVRVNAEGKPIGDVQLHPPTPNREFNRRLIDKVLRMEYIPAHREGKPVEAWAEITFVF